MIYATIPTALSASAQVDHIVRTVQYYSNGKSAFGVLSHGTCFFPKGGSTFAEGAQELLNKVANTHLDFVVKEMDDHNFIVKYDEHVFSIVFKKEFEENRMAIESDARNITAKERLMGKPDAPAHHLLIGLFARTRLIEDLKDREIVQAVQAS